MLPRGYKWEFGGRKFLALGGAPSIDFQHRTEGKSWWREEMIRDSDIERLRKNSDEIDVMLAHDAPDGGTAKVQAIIDQDPETNSWGWSDAGLAYARTGRLKMDEAVEIVNPKMFVHGHYHVADERIDSDSGRHWVSLGMDGVAGNVVVLDTETMKIGWVG